MARRSDPHGYYRALGVPHTATAEEIRLAFRALAMQSHPDRAAGLGDGEAFRLIREAYEVLRDPRRRMAYDASGLAVGEHGPTLGAARPDGFAHGRPTAHDAAAGGRTDPAAADPRATDPAAAARGAAGWGPNADPRTGAPGPSPGAGTGGSAAAAARRRRRRALRSADGRRWSLVASVLGLALLVALGSLWSARHQLEDRQLALADLYGRIAQMSEEQAELQSRYRSIAFLDLERALRRSTARTSAPITATTAAAVQRFDIAFGGNGDELDAVAAREMQHAMTEIAEQIARLPANGNWLVVLEAEAPQAALDSGVAAASWQAHLWRLAVLVDAVLDHGLPSDRVAVRFHAGFAQPRLPAIPPAAADRSGPGLVTAGSRAAAPSPAVAVPRARVSIQLLCCVE